MVEVITTAEERDALPAEVIVLDAQGTIACRHYSGLGVVFGDDRPFTWTSLALPLTVIWRPVTCRVCGCTDHHACITPEGPCRWVEADLCSNPECVEAAARPAVKEAAVVDLVAALRASVDAAKTRREEAGRG